MKLDHYLPSALCADPAGTSQGAGGTCDLCFAQAATHCPSPGPESRAGPPPGLTGEWGGRAGSASCPRSPGGHGLLAECPLRRAPVTRQPGPRTVLSRLVQTWFPGKRPLRLPGLCPESLICTGRQGALPTLHRTPTPRPVRRLSCHLPGHQGGGRAGFESAHIPPRCLSSRHVDSQRWPGSSRTRDAGVCTGMGTAAVEAQGAGQGARRGGRPARGGHSRSPAGQAFHAGLGQGAGAT